MKILAVIVFVFLSLCIPASAAEYTAPEVPESGSAIMPEETGSISLGLLELMGKLVKRIRPDLQEAASLSAALMVSVMLVSVLAVFPCGIKNVTAICGAVVVTAILLTGTDSMVRLGIDTVCQISEYGKMLLPVMTGALAAQGGITASAGLYLGTAFFSAVLSDLLNKLFVPMIYVYLALSVGNSFSGEEILKKLKDLIKNSISWLLKILMTVFTTYMGITGVVSGTTDAATLKATKITISTMVPVVGGVLSDASEAILVGAGVMKNAAGVYGIFAILALCLEPFVKILSHYLLLKGTAGICSIFGVRSMTGLIEDFSVSMGLLLAITGAVCTLFLISTICFMKGVS